MFLTVQTEDSQHNCNKIRKFANFFFVLLHGCYRSSGRIQVFLSGTKVVIYKYFDKIKFSARSIILNYYYYGFISKQPAKTANA